MVCPRPSPWAFESGVSSKLGGMKGFLVIWNLALRARWEHGDLVMARARCPGGSCQSWTGRSKLQNREPLTRADDWDVGQMGI